MVAVIGIVHIKEFGFEDRITPIFKDALEKKLLNNKKIFILIDDADAGTSIDVITEIKDIIALIYNDCIQNHLSFYIVLTANSYELTHFDNIDFVEGEDIEIVLCIGATKSKPSICGKLYYGVKFFKCSIIVAAASS